MPRPALVSRVPFTVAAVSVLLACQGNRPSTTKEGPGGPPAATSRGVFDPSSVGPGAPPQTGPARPLDAIDYGPIGRTEGNGQIHVRFNQPVIPLGLKDDEADKYSALFSFDPPLPGKARFTTPELLVFEPDEALKDCHSYTARFAGGGASLSGMNGQSFARPLTWTFETVRPTVTASHPEAGAEDLRRDSVVLFQLDRPASLAEVKAHVEATARSLDDDTAPELPVPISVREATKKEIKDHFYVYGNDSEHRRQFFAIKATKLWPAGSEIAVNVTPGLVSEAGPLPLDTPWSMNFKTYRTQGVESLSCAPDEPCGLEPIRLSLRNPVLEKEASKISLTPRPVGFAVNMWDSWGEGGTEVSLEGMFIPGTTYTVNIPASMRDIFGQTIAGGVKRPALIAAKATMALSSGSGILVPGKPGQPTTIGVESRHVKQLRVRIGVFDDREIRRLDERKSADMPFPGRTITKKIPLTPTGQGDWSSVALDLDALTDHARRPVLLEVSADELVPAALEYGKPATLRGLYRITDLGPVAITSLPASSVQVVRLSTGAPLPGAKVFRYAGDGALDLLGAAGADGQVTLPADIIKIRDAGSEDKNQDVRLVIADPNSDDRTYLDVDGPTVGERWRSRQQIEEDKKKHGDLRPGERLIARVVSERGVYRPGELVRVVGWSALDTPFSRSNLGRLAPGTPVKFELVDPQDQVVAVHPTTTTAEGKYWAELRLPAEARLGRYEVHATIGATTVETGVKVEDYRVPEFTVEATARNPDVIADESTDIDIRASYYFGGPVPIRRLTSATNCRSQRYRPPGLEALWTVGEPFNRSSHGYSPRVMHGTSEPDLTPGRRVLASKHNLGDDVKRYPGRCTISFEVQDESLQGIGAEAGYNVHPAAFYLAVAAPQNFPRVGDRDVRLPVRAVDFAGTRVAATSVDVTVTRHWRAPTYRAEGGVQVYDGDKDRSERVKQCSLDLTAAGDDRACDLPPLEEGRHDIALVARDAAGREAHTTANFYVYAKLRKHDWRTLPPPARLELSVSEPTVRPGDTLEVAVRGPWNGAVGTLVLARGGIRETHPFVLKDQSASFNFQVDDTWTPQVGLEATAVLPASATGHPRIETASATVSQPFEHRYLHVQVEAPAKAGPGDSIDIGVRVRDSQGAPTPARVALWAVDEAVLDLTSYEVPDLLPDFVVRRGNETARHDDFGALLYPYIVVPDDPWFDPLSYMGGGGGTGSGYGRGSGAGFGGRAGAAYGPPPARSKFETTPVFLADLEVGLSGETTVRAEMPENLTTFRITAVASARLVDGESPGRFGKNDTRTMVTAPLIVRAITPRQLRPGDQAELAAIVQNNTGTAGKVTVTATVIDKPGAQGQALRLLSSGTASADLPEGGQVRLPFRAGALVPGAPELELQAVFTPTDGPDIHDGVRIPLPVEAERTLTERVATYGTVTDDQPIAIPIQIPASALPGFGGVTIAATSSLLGDLEDAVDDLVTYPYGCVEQTSSRLLPLVALHDLRKTYPLGIADPQLFMQAGIDRLLAMQTRSGGFGYWPGDDEVHGYATAYATWVLYLASKAGYPVPEEPLKKALDDLEHRAATVTMADTGNEWGHYDGSRLAIAVHVLADAGRDAHARTAELFTRRQSLPLYARAFVLMALHRQNPQSPDVTTLAAELRGNLQELQATAHTSEAAIYNLDEFFDSDGRSDAILLMALLRVDPDHPVVVKLARGLLGRRIGGAWRNTQENAYALVALADYARHYEADVPDFTARAWVAQRSVLDIKFKGREFVTRSATTDMQDIVGLAPNPNDPLPIVLQRTGQGRLYYRLGAEWAPAETDLPARSQGITVTRSLRSKDGPVTTSVVAGEPVAMDIRISTNTRIRYLAIDVPLPAGLEGVSRTLGKGRAAATLGGSRGWWATHEEQRPDRVVIFADDLQPGDHAHTIDLRATSRGTFSLPPLHAEAMYMPEVYGRTTGTTLEVR